MSVASKIAPTVINGKQQYDKLPLIIYELNSQISFIHGMNLVNSLDVLPHNLTDITNNIANTSSLLPSIKNSVIIADRAIEDSTDLPANISTTHTAVVKGVTYIENGLTEMAKAYGSMSLLTTALTTNASFATHINTFNNLIGARNYAEKVMTQIGDDMNKASSLYANVIQTLSAIHEAEKEAEAALNTEDSNEIADSAVETNSSASADLNVETSENIITDLVENAAMNVSSPEQPADDSAVSPQGDIQDETPVYNSTHTEDNAPELTSQSESVVTEQESN